jgi:deoxyribonuclease V
MKLVLAHRLDGDTVTAAGVAFEDWGDAEAARTVAARVPAGPKPARGEPDVRALPALLQLLQDHRLQPDAIVVDDAVHLDPQDTPGLGRRLFDALDGKVPVIGASKAAMAGGTPAQFEVHREDEAAPLTVTCAGIDLGAAKARVRAMHGRKRVPTLLKLAARLAKGGGD